MKQFESEAMRRPACAGSNDGPRPGNARTVSFGILKAWLLSAALAATLCGLTDQALARGTVDVPETFGRGPSSLYAIREPNIFTHNVGLLTLQITNVGIIGNPFINELSAGWRGGEYLYASGLWVGAIGEDAEPHVSTALYSLEFRPSLLPIDTIYESYEGIRDGLRPSAFGDGDDDTDGAVDEDFQNGKDDDGDGRIDEDYASVGQQMYSCEYADNSPEASNQINDHVPLGLKVQQRSFQWATDGINEFVGFDFKMINVGDQRLKNIYIGFFADVDAGPKQQDRYWTDDLCGYVRVDTTVINSTKTGACAREKLSMDITYIWDAPDNGTTIAGGDVPGYFGVMFLGHTTDATGVKAPQRVGLTTVKWTAATGAYPQGDPRTDFERYDLLSKGELPRRNAVKPDDYRFTMAAGPFSQMNPGDDLSFQVAYVIGEGQQGMVNNAIGAQRIFNGQYVDGDQNPETGIDGKERCLRVIDPPGEIIWDDPCDTLTTTQRWRQTSCFWVNDDCSECSGVEGKESLLNWVGTTAPPPPRVNTDPRLFEEQRLNPAAQPYLEAPGRDRRAVLQWDNGSELRPDPITGVGLFEGYRVWKVNSWQRPEGSVGPTPQEWMLLAEFRKNPRDGLGLGSPYHLRRIERRDRDQIKEPTLYGPLYHVGRYEWADSLGVTDGKANFYAVTAFGVQTRLNQSTGEMEEIVLSGQPAAVQREVVVSSWQYSAGGCSTVGVVPNPYRGGADWDLNPADCDPTGTKVAFRNLPVGWKTLSIYTMAGDLVLSANPDDSRVLGGCEISPSNKKNGTFYWDLISRNGQNVVSGIYIYAIDTGGEICRGRFVIIR